MQQKEVITIPVPYRRIFDYQFFHISEAVICLSCDAVSNSFAVCPACGGKVLMPLERIVGRVREEA